MSYSPLGSKLYSEMNMIHLVSRRFDVWDIIGVINIKKSDRLVSFNIEISICFFYKLLYSSYRSLTC